MDHDIPLINESLRGFPAADAVEWHRLHEVEGIINNAKGGFVGNFSGLVAEMVRLRKKLGLPLGI